MSSKTYMRKRRAAVRASTATHADYAEPGVWQAEYTAADQRRMWAEATGDNTARIGELNTMAVLRMLRPAGDT